MNPALRFASSWFSTVCSLVGCVPRPASPVDMQPQYSRKAVKQLLQASIGFVPKDAIGWLYVARGFYKLQKWHYVVEAVSHCVRNEHTQREAQHLLSFSLLHSGQTEAAARAFKHSIQLGNHSDWQPLVEILLERTSVNV